MHPIQLEQHTNNMILTLSNGLIVKEHIKERIKTDTYSGITWYHHDWETYDTYRICSRFCFHKWDPIAYTLDKICDLFIDAIQSKVRRVHASN